MIYRTLPDRFQFEERLCCGPLPFEGVSVLGMGCAGIGQDYPPGTKGVYGDDAIRLIHDALEAGVNVFDTSPKYGDSEKLVAEALDLRRDEFSAALLTKFDPVDYDEADKSLNRCKRLPLFWQAAPTTQASRMAMCRLNGLRALVTFDDEEEREVRIGFGYTVHEEIEALAALVLGLNQLQCPWNIYDQRFHAILEWKDRLAVFGRSPLLRGTIHDTHRALRFAFFGYSDDECPHSVFVGIKSREELTRALEAVQAGRLSESELSECRSASCIDLDAIEPRRWDGRDVSF